MVSETDMIPSLMNELELLGSVHVLRVGSGVSDRGSIMCKNLNWESEWLVGGTENSWVG